MQIFVGPEVLPKKEIEKLIKEFLYQQLEDEEAGLTACLVIHTLNKPQEKVIFFSFSNKDFYSTFFISRLIDDRFSNVLKHCFAIWIT